MRVGCHTLTASLCQKPRPAFSCFKISTTVWCLWRHVQCACNKTPHSVGTVRVVQWKVSGGEGRGGEEEYCFFQSATVFQAERKRELFPFSTRRSESMLSKARETATARIFRD